MMFGPLMITEGIVSAVHTLNISGRQEIEAAIRQKMGGVWLALTLEQYAKLSRRGGDR
jgi:hypothetical protein